MEVYWLKIEFQSSTCFSGGAGFAGQVDVDIEQEEAFGLPWVRGRTIKGIIVEECAAILLTFDKNGLTNRWKKAAVCLFGIPGQSGSDSLKIGNAELPEPFRKAVAQEIEAGRLHPRTMLRSLTEIRNQTKISRLTKAYEPHSLRTTRLALKGLCLYSRISGTECLDEDAKALFAASVLAFRRGGMHRNRGWGKLTARILDAQYTDVTTQWVAPLLISCQQKEACCG